ncbi:MAG: hypothetical protein JNJ89_01905 [Rubrivivax sp.]|nr:hypothetical protein [Rubrivivax sp.]
MKRTDFRPSIHGWPFGNSFSYDLAFDDASMKMGFCGGMCWTALRRFYAGSVIALEPAATPVQGDPLYEEILGVQVLSLPPATLAQIFTWQQSPDLSHRWNPYHSLGHRTQLAWPGVREKLEAGHPVTLTLIASSNDFNPWHLKDNHRVVAYGFEERGLRDGEWVHGTRKAGIRKVTLCIYDPNFPGDDELTLSFFTGCDDSWIGMAHSGGDEFHAFFLDDEGRAFAHAEAGAVRIESCTRAAFVSAAAASYELKFTWSHAVIAFFTLEVNGQRWSAATQPRFGDWLPRARDIKQCAARAGTATLTLQLPRARSVVSVRLMDSETLVASVEVDAAPAYECYPYLRTPRTSGRPGVIFERLVDSDVFVAEPTPTAEEVTQLDTSPSRWIESVPTGVRVSDRRGERGDLTRGVVTVVDQYRLGNVVVPVMACMVERNLVPPVQARGTVTTYRHGLPVSVVQIPALLPVGQGLFEGFRSNPADYDGDTTVVYCFRATDASGVAVEGKAVFHGRSVIHSETSLVIEVFSAAAVAKYEMAAQRLVELGLLGVVNQGPGLPGRGDPPWPPHEPVPPAPNPRPPVNPTTFLKKLRANRVLQTAIAEAFRSTWSSTSTWHAAWKAQAELVQRPPEATGPAARPGPASGATLAQARRASDAWQREIDGVAIQIVASQVIDVLCERAGFLDKLRGMQG